MRILMLGWEFPPFIAGGLGTACHGLTKALNAQGHEVLFVLPKPIDRSMASHIQVLSPTDLIHQEAVGGSPGGTTPDTETTRPGDEAFSKTEFFGVQAGFSSPYGDFGGDHTDPEVIERLMRGPDITVRTPGESFPGEEPTLTNVTPPDLSGDYGGDMIGNTERYARLVLALARGRQFDVIHAHDWMTFPAGLWAARATGKPLVCHVHSTEFDRSGENINQAIYEIERRGMHGSMRSICVSMLTKSICENRYGMDPSRLEVVYNGIDNDSAQPSGQRIERDDKIVLFLGRITMQKGPEYFISAAKRVLEKVPKAKFVVAGSGDMAVRMIEQAAAIGIGHRVLFTGFLRGAQVDQIFQMASCYVMPSVSEPFGIAPLEAMRNDTPVIISKQSGVSEVLTHALKVDFWDIDEMANKIVAVLRYPPLGETLRQHGAFELRRLTWEGAAEKCVQTYGKAIGGMHSMLG